MEKMIQEAQQATPENAVYVPTEECLTCASGFDPNVGRDALFEDALYGSM